MSYTVYSTQMAQLKALIRIYTIFQIGLQQFTQIYMQTVLYKVKHDRLGLPCN